jgi:serine protease AprX
MDASKQSGAWRRTAVRAAATAVASATLVAMGVTPAGAATDDSDDRLVSVIVEGAPDAAAAEVIRLGGVVGQQLTIIDGVQAQVPASAVAAIAAVDGVRGVTPDSSVQVLKERWGDDTTQQDEKASKETGRWKAERDLGSANSIARAVGAQHVWDKEDPGRRHERLTGLGVGVALIDTGVTPVEGLATPGKVVNGPDLSLDSQFEGTRYVDGYGHGTHMAGLIAGHDTAAQDHKDHKDPKLFAGMAPDATIVNVKVGAADGSVDVSQVIAGIDWVVTNRASHDIRVINLSYGTESTQSYLLDPLAHAVESAWRAGIVVVVAAGNDGDQGPSPLTMPAADPFVIAVGSSDDRGKDKEDDWQVGSWTNSGTDARRPDLLAPGKSVVSLRDPGSAADVEHPEGRVVGDSAGRFFRGTGTSQSAAIVSGTVALLLQAAPQLTPDQVKGVLMASANDLERFGSPTQGAGVLDVEEALKLLEKALKEGTLPAYTQTWQRSTGLGSLEASRGDGHLVDPATGAPLTGEQDVFGVAWDAAAWSAASTSGTAWGAGVWRGVDWAGPGWLGTSWEPTAWHRLSWNGDAAAPQPWERVSWRGEEWSRVSWRGDEWSRVSWRGDEWSRVSWRADEWSRVSWRGDRWAGAGWNSAGW